MGIYISRRENYENNGAIPFLFSLAVTSIIISSVLMLVGMNPIDIYKEMFAGAFWGKFAITETLVKATPIMLVAAGLVLCFQSNFWNIGAEGQLVMGGVAASGFALFLANSLPSFLAITGMLLASFMAGALWAAIPAFLKSKFGVNEIIVTLMANYVAVIFTQFLYFEAWRNPQGFGFPGTAEFPHNTWLPKIIGRTHIGIIFAVVACLVVNFILYKTTFGFETRMIGRNKSTAKYAGVSVPRTIITTMIVAGGLAGIAGMCQVAGIDHKLQNGLAIGYGFTAIIVAFLADLKPNRVIFVSILMAGMITGSSQLQIKFGLPATFAEVMQGVILASVLIGKIVGKYQIQFKRLAKDSRNYVVDLHY